MRKISSLYTALLAGGRNGILSLSRLKRKTLPSKEWMQWLSVNKPKTNRVIRRLIPTKVRAILERVMATYEDVLFPGHNLDEQISIAAANRYIRRIRDNLPLEYWRTHDFRH